MEKNAIKELERIKKLYDKTQFYCSTDPEVALSQARKSAEAICKSVYSKSISKNGKPVEKMMLEELINGLSREDVIPKFIRINLKTIQEFGNFGVHDQGDENELIDEVYIRPCFTALGTVFSWYVSNFTSNSSDLDGLLNLEKTNTSTSPPSITKPGLNQSVRGNKNNLVVVGNHAPPSRIFEEDLATGVYFDILRSIGYDKNLKFTFEKASFDQSFKLLKRGKADLFIGPNKTLDREKSFHYSSHPLPKVMKAFFTSMDASPIIDYDDLYTKTIITMKNAFYSDNFNNDPNITRLEVANYETGVSMVERNPKYALIMPEMQGDYLLSEMDIDLVKSPLKIDGADSYIVYSKFLDQDYINEIEEGLDRLIKNGSYYEILDMYY